MKLFLHDDLCSDGLIASVTAQHSCLRIMLSFEVCALLDNFHGKVSSGHIATLWMELGQKVHVYNMVHSVSGGMLGNVGILVP